MGNTITFPSYKKISQTVRFLYDNIKNLLEIWSFAHENMSLANNVKGSVNIKCQATKIKMLILVTSSILS